MTAPWVKIAGDDLNELRAAVDAGVLKWTDDEVVMRLLWDLVAGVVGLAEELRNEHRETVHLWKNGRGAEAPSESVHG